MIPVNECYTRMRGDKFRRPDFTTMGTRESDGANIVTGVMRADTPEGAKVYPPLPDVPFSMIIPAGLSDWDFHQRVNVEIWYRLQNNETLMGLDFMPPPPPPPAQTESNWGGMLLLGLGVVFVSLAFSSGN